MASNKMLVVVNDEANNRQIELYLTNSQYERARRDSTYVEQLINENNNHDRPTTVTNEQETINNENTESLFIWSETCVLLLLALYEECKNDFTTKRHKKIFDDIAKKMKSVNKSYDMSGGQCQSKINSLKKTYKKIIDHNSKSGNDRITWPYFDRMNEIFGSTGWANPVATASEAGPSDISNIAQTEQKKKRKSDCILEELVKEKKKYMADRLALKKEYAEAAMKLKKEQHQEKMEILKSLCGVQRE